jgi:hypothetical protein
MPLTPDWQNSQSSVAAEEGNKEPQTNTTIRKRKVLEPQHNKLSQSQRSVEICRAHNYLNKSSTPVP